MDYRKIVWLASYPKSGNTWVRCFLDAYLTGEVDINNISASVSDDSTARCLPGDGSDPADYPLDVQILTRPMGLLRLVRQFELNSIEMGFDIPLFVKTHSAHMVANGVELLPNSLTKAVVHVVRDPRDVVISFAKHMGKDLDKGIELFFDRTRNLHDNRVSKMADFISSWPQFVSSYANADSHNVLNVKYEDMLDRPVHTFGRILKHSGIKPDDERIEKALELVKIDKLRAQEEKDGFGESSPHHKDKFFGKGKAGGWMEVLTPSQLHKIEKGCSSMMKRFNYEFATESARKKVA